MPDINITVAHKVAVSDTQSIVCDNSDYTVHWTLDEDWSAYDTKTMRTIYIDGTYTDKVFAGDTIALPVCTVPGVVQIGLFAGDIRASRMAILRALPSVRSAAGAPADPPESVYDQMMERMAQLETSDWAQNDPTAKDYVRNRTHYVSRESKALVPEQDVTTAEQDNVNAAILNNADLDALQTLLSSEDDTTFDVVFDGASYPCKWLEHDGSRIPVFGNLAIFDPSVTDTGEPFAFAFEGVEQGIAIACKVAGTHTVAVSCQQDVVHTLDPKYIKDMYYSASEEKNIAGVQIGTTYDGTEHDPIPFRLGQVWNANFENAKWSNLEVKQSADGTLYIGDMAVNKIPFYVSVTSGGVNSSWENMIHPGSLTLVGVSGTMTETVVHTIPDKYMPDSVRNGSLVSLVTALEPNHTTAINARGADRNTLVVFMVTTGVADIASASSIIDSSGTEYPIYSARTGAEISDAEHPYGVMLLKYALERWWCINPA